MIMRLIYIYIYWMLSGSNNRKDDIDVSTDQMSNKSNVQIIEDCHIKNIKVDRMPNIVLKSFLKLLHNNETFKHRGGGGGGGNFP